MLIDRRDQLTYTSNPSVEVLENDLSCSECGEVRSICIVEGQRHREGRLITSEEVARREVVCCPVYKSATSAH